jgi:hypothetical protein
MLIGQFAVFGIERRKLDKIIKKTANNNSLRIKNILKLKSVLKIIVYKEHILSQVHHYLLSKPLVFHWGNFLIF